jgi:hypothetical protein
MTLIETGVDISRLRFRYAIEGDNPPRRSVSVFDDWLQSLCRKNPSEPFEARRQRCSLSAPKGTANWCVGTFRGNRCALAQAGQVRSTGGG